MRALVAATVAIGAALLLSGHATAATIKVSTSGELEKAVSSAGNGDEIALAPGTYAPETSLSLAHDVTISGPATAPGARIVGSGVPVRDGSADIFVIPRGASVTIRNVAVTTADTQGSALNVYGSLVLENAEVSGNNGLSIWVQFGGRLSMTNSTVSDNGTDGVIVDGAATLASSTVTANGGVGVANTRGSVELTNTIVSGNAVHDCLHKVGKSSTSIDGDGSCGAGLKADPQLGSLSDNGGPTATRALAAGSPAVDAGAGCASTDQRFAVRTGTCDIGAYEYGATPPKATPPPSSGGGSGSGDPGKGGGQGSGGSGGGLAKPTRVTVHGRIMRRGHRATFNFDLRVGVARMRSAYLDPAAGIRLRVDRVSSMRFDATGKAVVVRGVATNLRTGRSGSFTLRLRRGDRADWIALTFGPGYAARGTVSSGRAHFVA